MSLPQKGASAMNRGPLKRQGRGATYPGLEIIANFATVLEVEPAKLLSVSDRRNT
jgi:hypothetical protein